MRNQRRLLTTLQGVSPLDATFTTLTALLYFFRPNSSGFPDTFTNLPFDLNPIIFTAIGLAYSLPMLFRTKHPGSSAALIILASSLRHLLEAPGLIIADIAVPLALHAVASYGPRLMSRTALSFVIFNIVFQNLHILFPQSNVTENQHLRGTYLGVVIELSFASYTAYALGRHARAKRKQIHHLKVLAQETQRHAENEANLAVFEERSRIARDMHDIVAHTLSVIVAQADGARYAATKDKEIATRTLDLISEMARDALKDIRSIVGVLRNDDNNNHPTLPSPIENDIMSLISTVQESGVNISFATMGQKRTLPVGVGNAAYRICQEAITNSLKHAGPHSVISVIFRITDTNLILQIDDDGRGAAVVNDGKGHGLIGMKERAAAFGGTLVSGPRSTGGYRVTATIPILSEGTRGTEMTEKREKQ